MTTKKSVLPVSKPRTRKTAVAAAQRQFSVAAASPAALLADLRVLILATRQTVAQGVNSALVLLYGQIGQRIRTDILKAKWDEYGEQKVHALSATLSWTPLRRILYLDDPLQRDFYAEITPRLATLRSAGVMRSSLTL